MASSPDFFQPAAAAPAYTPRLFVVTATADADQDGADYHCHTPMGTEISFLGRPDTCPPPPKPRRTPASVCQKRLFAAARDIVKLNSDDLAIFRPALLSNGKQQKRRRRRSTRRPVPPFSLIKGFRH